MLEIFEIAAKAVADPTRIRILKLLQGGEVCVCQLTTVLGLAPATVSKHLSVLKGAGLVQSRRDGKWVHYRLAESDFSPHARRFLDLVAASLDDDRTILADTALMRQVNAVPLQILCDQGRAALPEIASAAATPCCGPSP